MANRLRTVLLAAAALVAATAAKADVINFSGAPDGVASFTIGGVTFSAEGPGLLYTSGFGNAPNGTPGLIASDGGTFQGLRATIAGGTDFVSVDLGDYNSDDDNLYLNAYDALDNLLASASFFWPAANTGLQTLSVSAGGIDHVTFGGVGVQGSSVYADNFTFNGTGAVPEPSAWALMIAGFGLAGAAIRRRVAVA